MTRPRSALVSLSDTPWYHVVNRCVRRAFLCGHDAHTGKTFEHRRGWIETRIRELASVFSIDVAAYAVMSNHYHVVLRVDAERARSWSTDEVLRRWTQLFTGPQLVQRYHQQPALRALMGYAERAKVDEMADTYRARLFDLSWYMRVLNESIARQANAEDGVKGCFWEGRFKSQALLDEQALLSAMAYVDLNPVRAGIAESLEDSAHTSMAARLAELRGHAFEVVDVPASAPAPAVPAKPNMAARRVPPANIPQLLPEQALAALTAASLMPFDPTARFALAVPFGLEEYLDLVDTVGRVVHPQKRGAIASHAPALLQRLGMDTEAFIACADTFFSTFAHAVGTPASLIKLACARQRRALRGMATARKMQCTQL